MPSERVQRQIDHLLDQIEAAAGSLDWPKVQELADGVLRLDPENEDAKSFLNAAGRDTGLREVTSNSSVESGPTAQPEPKPSPQPASFANGRYTVKRFLGEGGKKKVYLSHDALLDRDVAFALIKSEGLDDAGRVRVNREAQAMGRLGNHPNIVTVYDIGDENGQPYLVLPILSGGDVEGVIEKAPEHKLPLQQALKIAIETCQGLELAHSKGIVHRDLKPGNVWLTEDGRAMIGDFGLAVAADRSRLTQAGMMVGTVSYMPPEQAMGGEVGPRSDLYSLGAMVYEMVCGRPPFVADDYVAIISQHLNTPPVAPSWHRPDCPPGLEALILFLLEKSPDKRPASAKEVLEALQAIDLSVPVAAVSKANPIERVARGVFVGRERELQRLRQAWDEAYAGRGGVVMLVGEPGIGKTRTAQELETYVRIRGGQVLWGRAHEASGAPPYWPWVQAIRSYTVATPPDALRAQLGSGATEVARIVSEVRERIPDILEPAPITDPEQAQFRLFDAVSAFLRNASTSTPLLIVLDDLHWADRPTLLLLQHLAGEIGRSRLLLLGNYRDVEVGRHHPLADVLADLNREQLFQRVLLRGLSREDVELYIRSSSGLDPVRELLESIYQETEGNPFFLSEVVALMAQEGTLSGRGSAMNVPQGVREVLGRRLDRLSAGCNEVLGLAAIIGREFSYELLAALSEHDDERLLELTEEALTGRVIEETGRPGEYRFSHALVQETLLGELSTTRRVRLHGRVAEAMEKHYGAQAERHATELALHFSESATLTRSHARHAAHYSCLAGAQAEADAGWGEGARHYRRALALVRDADDDLGQDEAGLRFALARCERAQRNVQEALEHFLYSIELYRSRGDAAGMARAVLDASQNFLFRNGQAPGEAVSIVEDALALLGDQDPHLRAGLLSRLIAWTWDENRFREAQEIAVRLGHADVEGEILVAQNTRATLQRNWEQVAVISLTLRAIWQQLGNRERTGEAWYRLAWAKSQVSLDEGEAIAREGLAFVTESRLGIWQLALTLLLEKIVLLRGDLSEKESVVTAVPREAPGFNLGPNALNLRAFRAEARGELEAALAILPEPDQFPLPTVRALIHGSRSRIQFEAGHLDDARASLALWREANLQSGPNEITQSSVVNEITQSSVVVVDNVLIALGDDELVRTAYEQLQHPPLDHVALGSSTPTGLDHLRGALALGLGLVEEAEAHYRIGLEWAERERAVTEEGHCLQGLAAVAEARGDKRAQAEHLDRAAIIFQRIGANLYLRQVLAKKDLLKA